MSEDEDADAGEMTWSVIERLQGTLDATAAELEALYGLAFGPAPVVVGTDQFGGSR